MEKLQLRWLVKNKKPKFRNNGQLTQIYELSDGRIFKYFFPELLNIMKLNSIDIEQKILDSSNVSINSAIIKPEAVVYDGQSFVGYIMQAARGIDYNTWDQNLTIAQRGDLYQYARIYSALESIVRSTADIVYPDLCTCDNIYICNNDIQLIDYDGLQVGKHQVIAMSTTLGSPEQYINSKKYYKDGFFTKELDKKSLILLYFLTTFNINLNNVGLINPFSGCPITLDDIFSCINLQDDDIKNKVWQIFYGTGQNEYLGEDVFRLAEDYKMDVISEFKSGTYLKKLIK